jgi:serine O-acetyltransferase
LHIAHFGTIVVNKATVMGKNCNLSHGVTIGQANRGEKKGVPLIGDFVWIGTGAVVVGNVTIGSNVLIAPNTYVNMDVPDNSIVIGNPAKIISRENPTEGYINNVL